MAMAPARSALPAYTGRACARRCARPASVRGGSGAAPARRAAQAGEPPRSDRPTLIFTLALKNAVAP